MLTDKILSVFYGEDRLPYKDASRETHYPIVNGNVFNGANNVTKIRYYLDRIGGFTNVTWVVVSKLPNGQLASEVLNSNQAIYDEELGEHYIDFEISSYYTTLKGDVYLSLQGYQGGVEVEQDEDTGIYSIYGTPTIQATGSIKIGVNYAPQIVQGTHFTTSDLQQVLGLISEKANISDTFIIIDNILADISSYSVGQVFFDKEFKSYWVKGSDNSLQSFDVKLERAVTLTGTETIANLVLPNLDIANWGIGKYNDTLLFVKVLITTTPTPNIEYTIYQLSKNGEIKCWHNDNATGSETIAQVLATTPTNEYATKGYVDSTFAKPSDLVYTRGSYQVVDITTTTIGDIYSNVDTSETFSVGGSNLLFRGTYLLEKGSNVGSNYNFKITCIEHDSVEMIGRYWQTTIGGIAHSTTLSTIFNNLLNEPATTKYVDDKIADFMQREYQNVDTTTYPTLDDFLASTGTEGYIYLYPTGVNNDYYQYIWESNGWVSLGTTQLELSNYYTKDEADDKFATITYTNNEIPNIDIVSLSGIISTWVSNQGVALADDTNKWYYWDGSSYIIGGDYKKPINEPTIKSLIDGQSLLLIEDNDIFKGIKTQSSSFHNETGYLFGNNYSAFATTYPISVKPNTTYAFYINGEIQSTLIRIDACREDKTYLSTLSTGGTLITTFTTPENCYFVILTAYISVVDFNNLMILESGQTHENAHLDVDIIKDGSISNAKLSSPILVDNGGIVNDIFTDKTVIQNKNINYTTGAAENNQYFVACDFQEIEPETTYHVMRNNYKLSQTGNIAFYNANKQYISGQQSNWSNWTTPANAKYVRFSVYIGNYTQETFSFDNVVIVKGNEAKSPNEIALFENKKFSVLRNKKWVVIGDSITEVNYRTDLHYHDYIKSRNNMSVVNMGVGGTGYINRQSENKAFYQRALSIPTDADIITIFGGVNDCLFATADIGEPTDDGTTTWCGCVNQLITNIRSLYLFAPLGIISPLPCNWIDTGNESQYDAQLPSDETCRMSLFVSKLKKICELRGVPFLDLFHTSNMLPENSSFSAKFFSCGDSRNGDGLHPNSEGHKLFTSKIEKFIKTLIEYK